MGSLSEVQNHPDMQYNLLSVLGNRDQNDVSLTLLGMSTSPETCAAMRSSGCLPLIIRLLYAPDSSPDMKKHVSLALNNIINSNSDQAQSKLEGRVLSLLETVRHYCDNLSHLSNGLETERQNKNIGMTVATILRLSFDGDQRRAISILGGIHSIANLIQVLHKVYGDTDNSIHCLMLKRYASMAMTNLTSGHGSNKALLCSLKLCMNALVAQLNSPSEELQQATASVIRNLSWKADTASKQVLRETGAISILMKIAMKVRKESTLKSMLSALWNLSSNCNLNKIELCAVSGALGFLTHTLSYKSPSQSLCVIEYAGGVLRNVSSHVAERESYRAILREHDCLQVVTQHLTSPSIRVVGNACIILWNLSFDSPEDQYTLWMLGAPNLLRNLVHSKHKLIALGSSAALKNLLSGRPEGDNLYSLLFGPASASLSTNGETSHRRSKTVEEELDEVLSESPLKEDGQVTVTGRRDDKFVFTVTDVEKKRQQRRSYHKSHSLSRSSSKEFLSSIHHESSNTDRKHSSNVDLSCSEDSLPARTNDEKFNGKYACLLMKDDTEGDLSFDNEAISTVDELLEVVKDMASLRLNEDATKQKTDLKGGAQNEESVKSVDVKPETNNVKTDIFELKTEDLNTSAAEAILEESLTGDDSSLVKRESKFKEESSPEDVEKSSSGSCTDGGSPDFSPREYVPSTIDESPSDELVSPADYSTPKNVSLVSPRSVEDPSTDELTNQGSSSLKKELSSEELQPSLEELPSDELLPPEDYSTPKNVSLVSPRSIDLLTDELTNQEGFSVKKELSSEELQPSLEELPPDEEKKEVVTEEELERSFQELTFEEDVKEDDVLVYPPNDEEPAELITNAHYALDFSLGDSDDKNSEAERDSSSEGYGDYAETDLDQPTDYSLQYGEEDELVDDDEIHQGNKRDATFYVTRVPISIHEDTVKTYCTEGTPFETPYNYSTATSMSDLRAEPSIKEEMDEIGSETASIGQKDAAEAILDAESFQEKLVDDDILLDRIHSVDTGLLSPAEKPVQFYEEGTPGQCISRFSSLSSLCEDGNQSERPQIKDSVSRGSGSPYTNRGSELAYHDLPLHSKPGDKFSDDDPVNVHSQVVMQSVFEDAMVSFKDETTPINFSGVTSLSSLSFDDEPKIPMDVTLKSSSSQKVSSDLIQERLHLNNEDHPGSALPASGRLNSHQMRTEEGFSAQSSIQEICDMKPVPSECRSPRVAVKQETESMLLDRSNGEDTDAYEDTTYRFCTEGTPANVSHAGSHTDLFSLSIPHHRREKLSDKIDESSDDNLCFSDDCENILAECIMSGMPKMAETKRSSGMQSTSLPVGNGNAVSDGFAGKEDENGGCEQTDNVKQPEDLGEKAKVVTFDNADHYAEETPLMFSRASSLASLSSFDQQSIVDDRSSIISDLSRLTSGAVSPSEVPDSYSQMASVTSHRSKAPSVGGASDTERTSKPGFTDLPQPAAQPYDKIGQSCVFEDDVKPFKVEDTPVQFSRATSLSSLSTCDDAIPKEEETASLMVNEQENLEDARENLKDAPEKQEDVKADDDSDKNSLILESEGEEDDDAILAACISIGMQQSRKPPDSNSALFNNFTNRNRFPAAADRANYKTDGSNNSNNRSSQQVNNGILSSSSGGQSPKTNPISSDKIPSGCSEPVPESGAFDDVTHRYLTEDTPAISQAASHSDLSVLSFLSEKDDARADESGRSRTMTELSDDVFSVSDTEGMLAECIQAGMPKKSTNKKRNNSLTTFPESEINGNLTRHPLRDNRNGIEIPRQQCRDDRNVFHNLSPRHLPRDDRNGLDNFLPRHLLKDDRNGMEQLPPRHQFKDDRNGFGNLSPRRQVRDDRNGTESPRQLFKDDKIGINGRPPRHLPKDDRNGVDILSIRHQFRDDRNGMGNLSPRYTTRDDRNGIENFSPRHLPKDDRNGVEHLPPRHQFRDDRNGIGNPSQRHQPREDRNGMENQSPRHLYRDDRNGCETFNDRPRSNVPSQQLSPVLHKSKPTSRPMSANSHVSSFTTKTSNSRKSRRGALDVEPRRVENLGAFEDSMYRFNTEDTPANVSHAGSNSDISVLSIPDDDKEFYRDFHRHNLRQHSFHYLSDDSADNSDSEHILAECILSGMPKAKSSSRPMCRPSHPNVSSSHSLPHHALDLNSNSSRRSLTQGPVQQRHSSRSTSRSSKNMALMRRSLSQSDRPYNYSIDVNHSHAMPHQSFGNDAILNRNVAAAGMWSNSATHKLPYNREKEVVNARATPNYPNNNSHAYDSGWEVDPSILKDSQALRSLLLNHPNNARWLRRLQNTSPNHRRYSESQSSAHTFYSRENSSSMLQSRNDPSSAVVKGAGVLGAQQPHSLPSSIRPLDRQRTFTKLEPSFQPHLPSPCSKTKIPVPAQAPIKLPEKTSSNSRRNAAVEQAMAKGKFKSKPSVNSQPKRADQDKVSERMKTSKSSSSNMASSSKASCTWSGKSTPTSSARCPATSSAGSLVFKQNTAERRSFRVPKQTGLEDKRSNSFSSITSSASSKSSVRPFKKEVASKVASLWKRTDSSDDGQGKASARNESKSSDSEKCPEATRRMVRSATFEGLVRNVDVAKSNKVKDESQVKSCNHIDRPKKTSHKSRFLVDNKDEEMNKAKAPAQYNKTSEHGQSSRDDHSTSVINRHDRALPTKSSLKPDQNSVRVTKV